MQSVKPFNIENMPHMFKNMFKVQWEFAPFLIKNVKKSKSLVGKKLS